MGMFRNPIMLQGADPWVHHHIDGLYYFMVTRGNRLDLWRSRTLTGVAEGECQTIWTPPSKGPNSANLWAPEIHYLQGSWYVYFTANDGGGDDTRRIYVLECQASDPLAGEWIEKGAVETAHPGLDGSVMELGANLYFLYAGYGYFPDYGSALYIKRMTNPWTVEGKDVLLSAPTYAWEKQGGMAINEGPVVLQRHGRVFLVYSASTTWADDYALGMLTASQQANPMEPTAWTKSPQPVFQKHVGNGVLAPGHNSFTTSPDGTEDWIVYHALPESGAALSRRSTRVQKFGWNNDGTPDFGRPVSTDTDVPVPSGE